MSTWKLVLATFGALTLAACATIPKPLEGTYTQVTPQAARSGSANKAHVRWGGQLISTEPEQGQTCFYVLAHPLDSTARPRLNESDQGRFVACHSGFYDPEIFVRGREVTFTGTLHGIVSRKIGKYDYPYPRLNAETVYLWPKRSSQAVYRDPFWGPSPFWGPGYWGPYYSPYYGPRNIIVRPRTSMPPPTVKRK